MYRKSLISDIPAKSFSLSFRSVIQMITKPITDRLTGKHQLNKFYESLDDTGNSADFAAQILEKLGIRVEINEAEIAELKKIEGPLVLMSNHPFGGVEALVMIHLMSKIREDYRFLSNQLLSKVEELNEVLVPFESEKTPWIFVNPFQNQQSQEANNQHSKASFKSLLQLRKYLSKGGLLGIFPAGEQYESRQNRRNFVPQTWDTWISKLVLNSKATVVPIYFHGRNSWIYRLSSFLSPNLREKFLSRSFLSDKNKTIYFRIGKKITYQRLSEYEKEFSDENERLYEVNRFLQGRLNLLSLHFLEKHNINVIQIPVIPLFGNHNSNTPIIKPIPKNTLLKEVHQLLTLENAKLLENDQYYVLGFKKSQAPFLMREVGRLREETFRAVGEGSGKDCDTDDYDEYYTQLVLWDKQKEQVAGGYRIGKTDEILAEKGIAGIYVCTLFNVKTELLEKIQPAIELGRSFVAPEYQRGFQPLLLLWTGICQFILKGNLKYRYIIGPVSISADMNLTSKTLLVNFLEQNQLAEGLAKLVQPKKPFEGQTRAMKYYQSFATDDMRDLQEAIIELENEQMGIPVLFKHYLKMGAKMLAFNIDEDFSDVLDCFMMTDLLQTDQHLLGKYMTKEGLAQYLAYHQVV